MVAKVRGITSRIDWGPYIRLLSMVLLSVVVVLLVVAAGEGHAYPMRIGYSQAQPSTHCYYSRGGRAGHGELGPPYRPATDPRSTNIGIRPLYIYNHISRHKPSISI
jgi:hypothetical protein